MRILLLLLAIQSVFANNVTCDKDCMYYKTITHIGEGIYSLIWFVLLIIMFNFEEILKTIRTRRNPEVHIH